jgi:MmeI, DNA-methyltransferase domain/MmeI, N-terminal domain/MmeI, helicase spacer domain/MmeI, target recognition domain
LVQAGAAVTFDAQAVSRFIERWSVSRGSEHAVYQQFFVELCDLLGVPRPDPSAEARPEYCFEKPVVIAHEDGRSTTRFIDFYKKDHFVLEAKQGSESGDATIGTARRGTATWDKAMRGAYGQALKYASYLPEGKPPFLITCDIGGVFEIWTAFSGAYGGYGARQTIPLDRLADPTVFDTFVKIFTDPWDLDPARHAQRVTREVAARLAALARALEADDHDPELVAQFLMRAIFTMFCEDVGLLPESLFTNAIRDHWIPDPRKFQPGVEQLWHAMRDGLPFGFVGKLLKFNGGLFETWQSLPMTGPQLELLLEAAKMDWASVEPAIFGTLVERALDPVERRKLGAHFTPREYIERLVRPTVIEPLRAEWEIAQAEARQLVDKGAAEPTDADRKKAAAVLRRFHEQLCHTRVLDPACGSGNFLYVTLDLFKEIEAEVLRELADLGETQALLEMRGVTVNPGQFLGIEINPRAREIADLVLWIGYLQWHRRAFGDVMPAEPVLKPYKNIACRDAVLEYDDIRPRLGDDGKPVTVWDMRTTKISPITGQEIPDETARVPVLDYINPRPAEWPEADYVVSNPPFIGNKMMRKALGDGYVEALKQTYPKVSGAVDLVLYWWNIAGHLIRAGDLQRAGFITTNSITQTFNRSILEPLMSGKNPIALAWAIPDHPWVEAGADVRIAMTVAASAPATTLRPVLGRVNFEEKEKAKEPQARRVDVVFKPVQKIHADLSGGADVASATPLRSNKGLSFMGVTLVGKGFKLYPDDVRALGYDPENLPPVIRPHMNARELAQTRDEHFVIDFFGLSEEEARGQFPPLYQWLLDRVKPDREQNKRASYREKWWVFGEPRKAMREALEGLERFIVTPETSKHKFFVVADMALAPDHKLYVIASDDPWAVGVLSSRNHVLWAFSTGGRIGVGNDLTYVTSRCFDPFPFPAASEAQKARIRELGERLDAHRKRVQAEFPDVTLTGMYNALERLREIERGEGEPLTAKERAFHEKALIGILKQIHDDLDAAVADAYGWPVDLPDEEILERLVALNHERAAEEQQGLVRWLRPEFQNPEGTQPETQGELAATKVKPKAASPARPKPWPKSVPEQLRAIRDLLAARPETWAAEDVAAAFTRARRTSVEAHLITLEELGVLVSHETTAERRWGALASS